MCTYIARERAKFLGQLISYTKITERMYGIASSCREFEKVWIKRAQVKFFQNWKRNNLLKKNNKDKANTWSNVIMNVIGWALLLLVRLINLNSRNKFHFSKHKRRTTLSLWLDDTEVLVDLTRRIYVRFTKCIITVTSTL